VREKLIERGGRVESFTGSHYRAYSGIGWRVNSQNQVEKYTVKGRVVIDGHGWNRFNPNSSVYVTPLYVTSECQSCGVRELTAFAATSKTHQLRLASATAKVWMILIPMLRVAVEVGKTMVST
jgi:hypothetical protein